MEKMLVSVLVACLVRCRTYEMLEAVEAVGAKGVAAVEFVAPLLHSTDRAIQRRAAIALERIGVPAVDALVATVALDDSAICTQTIGVLKHTGDCRAVDTLALGLNDGVEHCRWMAAAAFGRIGGDAGRALVEAAFAESPDGQAVVEELLGCI